MLNIILLTNSTKYTYHATASSLIQSALQNDNHVLSILDVSSFCHNYECLNQIKSMQPDVIITLDLAGFSIRTQSGETALNMLLTKNLNLIWGNKPEYASLLNGKLSLSMLFYDATGIDHHLTQLYPNLLYYKVLGKLPLSSPVLSQTAENFKLIWSDFIREALLSET